MTKKSRKNPPWVTAKTSELANKLKSLNSQVETLRRQAHLRLVMLKKILGGTPIDPQLMARMIEYVTNNGVGNEVAIQDGPGDGTLVVTWRFDDVGAGTIRPPWSVPLRAAPPPAAVTPAAEEEKP